MNTDRIERAKELLQTVRHAAMATVNDDGTPHNTPYFFVASDDLTELYWGSHPDSLHSQNIARDGNIFVVLYEANAGGGLYIKCQNARQVSSADTEKVLTAFNKRRAQIGKDPLPANYYESSSPQRLYVADTVTCWVNYAERDENGLIIQDKRLEVPLKELIKTLT